MRDQSCAAVVLAAGASTRLGQPKQLLKIGGESLLRRTARLAVESGFSPVVVVLGSDAELFESEFPDLSVRSVQNLAWKEGMASSLQCGLNAVLAAGPVPANLLILVCDQPQLTLAVLHDLLEKHISSNALITASSYAGIKGVPAIFSRAVFSELTALRGDEGARRVIARYPDKTQTVDFPGGENDIDTPEDLANAGVT